jgi:predicted RNA-binding protein YlqC (UPF0109 family)
MESHELAMQMLQNVAECLVDFPENLTIVGTVTDAATMFVVTPDPRDMGKLVGRQGRTARAIRTILVGASMNHRMRYTLDIRDPGVAHEGAAPVPRPSVPRCAHCGCTEANACITPRGPCSWMSMFFPRRVCSNAACYQAELKLEEVL